jgi:plastocyanin
MPEVILNQGEVSMTIPALSDASQTDTVVISQVIIQHVSGSAVPGCEPNCFDPSNGVVNPGGMVTWENNDNAPHTTTSGTPSNGPDNEFDSGLIMSGQTFSYTFDDSGIYDYYCMVHPWMIGKVTVTGNVVVTEPQMESQVQETVIAEVNSTPIMTDTINIASFAMSNICDDEKNCLDPYHAQVMINQNVTWTATPFTTSIVSGNITDGPDGIFDFGFKINEESVFAFNQPGTYQYFDMMHPWIAGNVTVTGDN